MKLRIAGVDLYVGYEAAAAMTAVLLLDRENRVICCFLAAVLHELGHIAAMRLCGVAVRGLRLRLFDVLIEADQPPDYRSDCMITLGGVAANFFFALIFLPFGMKLSLPNIALGVFNLMPVMSLDGGHLLYIAMERRFQPKTCIAVIRLTTFVFIVPLMTAGIYLLLQSSYNYSLLAISLYLSAVLLLKS